ncbi:hypothetical protein HAZT_HAZT010628, partial [Hyalella azteca]
VLNALDAQASSIKVSINYQLFKIQVEDNGHGISKHGLKLLGDRHVTSKRKLSGNGKDGIFFYGSRGQALASLVEVSGYLEIRTRRKVMRAVIELENLKTWIESIALVHPQVSFSLRNDNGSCICRMLQAAKCDSTLERLKSEDELDDNEKPIDDEEVVPIADVVKPPLSSRTQDKLNAFRCKRSLSVPTSSEEPKAKYGKLVGVWDVRSIVQGVERE